MSRDYNIVNCQCEFTGNVGLQPDHIDSMANAPKIDYGQPENWLICEADSSANAKQTFDVFYIHPTQVLGYSYEYLDITDQKIFARVAALAQAQTGIFNGEARIFCPKIRQLGPCYVMNIAATKTVPWEETKLYLGIRDARDAFMFYLEKFNNGRPFILFGHSQGSMELYCLIKSPAFHQATDKLVAAYLIGLPNAQREKLANELAPNAIKLAEKEDDIRVLITWNTQNVIAKDKFFAGPSRYCINPLNWRTDDTPADAKLNLRSCFYDGKTRSVTYQENVCGATIDTEKGRLLVDLPADSIYDGKGTWGIGVFHPFDISLFAENIHQNAIKRVMRWLALNS